MGGQEKKEDRRSKMTGDKRGRLKEKSAVCWLFGFWFRLRPISAQSFCFG